MLCDCISKADLNILRNHLRVNRDVNKLPLFIFPCGGDQSLHSSRRFFRAYVSNNHTEALKNVFCLTAEDVAAEMDDSRLNLLQQEAMLADISDWILIFAESCGSFCELGAFSALPHAAWITSVAVGKQYKGSRSFLIDGPVKEIATGDSSLNKVFFLDLNNPMSSPDLCRFVSELRPLIGVNAAKRGKAGLKAARKMINRDEAMINVGSLVHELLDLLQILGPMSETDLRTIYCAAKGFRASKLKIYSPILNADMKNAGVPISWSDVCCMMRATGLVSKVRCNRGPDYLIKSTIHLDSYFMFKGSEDQDFSNMRARVILRKRSMGYGGVAGVYCG